MKENEETFKDCYFHLKPLRKLENINKYIGVDGYPQLTDQAVLLTYRHYDNRFFIDTKEVTEKIKKQLKVTDNINDFNWITINSGFIGHSISTINYLRFESTAIVEENQIKVENKQKKLQTLKLALDTNTMSIANVFA
jgi:hypothetical protein